MDFPDVIAVGVARGLSELKPKCQVGKELTTQ